MPAPSGEIPPRRGKGEPGFHQGLRQAGGIRIFPVPNLFTESEGYRIDGTKWPDFGDKALIREAVWSDFTAVLAFRRLSGKRRMRALFGFPFPRREKPAGGATAFGRGK